MFFNYIGSDIDWKYNTEPEKNACLSSPEQRCFWPRGKVLGGTSGNLLLQPPGIYDNGVSVAQRGHTFHA